MEIIKSILTENECYKAGKRITVMGLMLHSVGINQPSASVFVKNWNKSGLSKCVHAFIDGNTGKIYQTLPWDRRGWHCGNTGNNTHIGVEMCEPACIKYTSGSKFTCSDLETARAVVKRTYESAVELFAYLCKQYNLDPTKDGVIISHKEGYKRGVASNHGDPEHLWEQLGMSYTMNTFRKAVKSAMTKGTGTATTTPSNTESVLYRVQVGAYSKKSNAEAMVKKLEKAGFDAIIVSSGDKEPVKKKSVEEIAKEVINGLWGNGEARKKKLTDAGYDFEAVQAKVNELLK